VNLKQQETKNKLNKKLALPNFYKNYKEKLYMDAKEISQNY